MTLDHWGEIKERLLKTVGQNNYTTWIEPLVPGAVEDGIVTLKVPTNFFGNYVSQNFSDLILHEINATGTDATRLNFALNQQPTPAAEKPAPAARQTSAAAKPAANSQLSTAPLDPRFSFDNFVVGKPNELAVSPKAAPSPSTRCSFMGASALVRPT